MIENNVVGSYSRQGGRARPSKEQGFCQESPRHVKRQGRVNPRQKECRAHSRDRTKTHEGGWQMLMEVKRCSSRLGGCDRDFGAHRKVFSWGVMRDLISSCSAQFMQGMSDRSHGKSHRSSMVAKGEAEEVMPTEAEVTEKGVFWED